VTDPAVIEAKRKAMDAVISEAKRDAERVRVEYPGLVGKAMAYRITMCAIDMVRTIAAYTPPDPGATVMVVGPNVRGVVSK